ncbi:helix-turn-helix domain-containing protein [Paracoccus aminophilus]|uniref:Transcriptional regulator, XRE family n=1 Tax=Paracoccus aminophilus JCM 7686 TaxID=1367847 RepID=S5YIF8_PARAH|nr:cupin domain-containing protein [Paracoccus aminophilus]AGT11263.1 transcriptional regulator, XRE family [Paracoccus aminophilus JCM 7686]
MRGWWLAVPSDPGLEATAEEQRPKEVRPAAATHPIGEKLRLRRKLRKLSLREVSERAGVSIGLLSQVERGLTMPSVRSMHAICAALDMPVFWLFETQDDPAIEESAVIVRHAARRKLHYSDNGLRKEILTPDTVPQIQMLRFTLDPGADSGEPYRSETGGKCGLVTQGTLGLEVEGRRFLVRTGDSFAFPASSWVRFWAEGEHLCEVIWVVSPATI